MKDYRTILLLLLAVGIVLPVAVSFAQEGDEASIEEEYLLVVGDQVQIIVEGQPEYSRPYAVPVEGQVAFPPLGRITLIGKSMKTIAEEIEQELEARKVFTDPVVYVMLDAYAPREAFLWGAATGAVPLQPHKKHTLMQVLSTARVQLTVADLRSIRIRRTDAKTGKKFDIPVNLQDAFATSEFKGDPVVMPDDIIYIPLLEDLANTAHVYILGKVNKPGRYSFIEGREKMKLSSLVALAGDFHQFADESSIRILRQKRSGTELIKVDFDEIIDQEIEDPTLQPEDLVWVPESFF